MECVEVFLFIEQATIFYWQEDLRDTQKPMSKCKSDTWLVRRKVSPSGEGHTVSGACGCGNMSSFQWSWDSARV